MLTVGIAVSSKLGGGVDARDQGAIGERASCVMPLSAWLLHQRVLPPPDGIACATQGSFVENNSPRTVPEPESAIPVR